ncbi:MAG: hypothetical protein ACI4WM_10415, partial [Erysipelotrichaceae bacterium]
NTKDKRICIAHPEGSGKSDLLNLLMTYYGDYNDDFFDYKDEHFRKYDVIRINFKEIFQNNPDSSYPIEIMYDELLREVKSEYRLIKFDKKDELSDVLRKIYAATRRQFMIFIDDNDFVELKRRHYDINVEQYIWYMPELVPDKDEKHIALVYATGVLPIKSTFTQNYLKRFREYTIYNPCILTQVLRSNTHSSDVSYIEYLVQRNTQLTKKYIKALICGIKVPVNLDKFMHEMMGERAALAILSYMGVIRYEDHTVFLNDERMRIYLFNAIDSKKLNGLLETKNVFEEEYVIDKNMDRNEIVNDILAHNFNMAIKYKLPEISCYDECVTITYYPKDEFKETEQKMVIYLGDNIRNDNCDDAQIVVIKI